MVIATSTRLWQLIGGLITIAIIAKYFSGETQGIFYIFADLLAIQTLFDLGLTGVLLSLSSREWPAALNTNDRDDASQLARQRLGSLIRQSTRWFVVMAALFAITASVFGMWWLNRPETEAMQWRGPWLVSVVLTALAMCLMPCIGIIEGRFVVSINVFRLVQAILGNLVVWTVITQGGELWAVAASTGVRLACESFFVLGWFRKRLVDLIRQDPLPADDALDWRSTVRPLQWRIALQSLMGYFATRTYTLIVMDSQSVAAAGRIGMSWAILIAIQAAGLAWLQARLPQIGRLVAQSQITEARRLVRHTAMMIVATMTLGTACLVGLIVILNQYYPQTAMRLMPLPPTLLFSVSLCLVAMINTWSTYARLFRIDPFVRISLIGSTVLTITAIGLGTRYGAMGIAIAHLGTTALVNVPLYRSVLKRELAIVEKN